MVVLRAGRSVGSDSFSSQKLSGPTYNNIFLSVKYNEYTMYLHVRRISFNYSYNIDGTHLESLAGENDFRIISQNFSVATTRLSKS